MLRRRQAVVARQRVVEARRLQRLRPRPALLLHRVEHRQAAGLLGAVEAERRRTCRSARRRPAASRRAATPAAGASPRPGRCRARGWSAHRGSAPWPRAAGRAARPAHELAPRRRASRWTGRCGAPCPPCTSVASASSCSWIELSRASLVGSK